MKNGEEDRAPNQAGATRSRSGTDAGLKARQKVIGAGLKRLYDSIVDEDVPDEFSSMLAQFDSHKTPGGSS
jgi:hypothetical protein